ncbi:HTH domain-containing protein [Priestia aryabhattai]|uniref:HTH domain-containing protein n=1 Tax=Priestia aryabhattai TaxID=412384 RepID=UPI003D28FA6C
MTKFHIIEKQQFTKLQELERTATYTYQRSKVANYIYTDVEAAIGLRPGTKLAQIIQRIIYLASDRGYSYPGRETLAEQFSVSTRTVDKAIKALKESGMVDVFYRYNPRSNSAKTCVFIFRTHTNYAAIKRILRKQYEEKFEEELRQTSTESKADAIKQIATSILRKKQDLKINKRLHNVSKIIEYLALKIEKVQQNNPGGITALSSYIDKTIAQELRKVNSQERPAAQATGAIPIFNWLETS